jgi:hypothetical protein
MVINGLIGYLCCTYLEITSVLSIITTEKASLVNKWSSEFLLSVFQPSQIQILDTSHFITHCHWYHLAGTDKIVILSWVKYGPTSILITFIKFVWHICHKPYDGFLILGKFILIKTVASCFLECCISMNIFCLGDGCRTLENVHFWWRFCIHSCPFLFAKLSSADISNCRSAVTLL